jgi:hypothetical protein
MVVRQTKNSPADAKLAFYHDGQLVWSQRTLFLASWSDTPEVRALQSATGSSAAVVAVTAAAAPEWALEAAPVLAEAANPVSPALAVRQKSSPRSQTWSVYGLGAAVVVLALAALVKTMSLPIDGEPIERRERERPAAVSANPSAGPIAVPPAALRPVFSAPVAAPVAEAAATRTRVSDPPRAVEDRRAATVALAFDQRRAAAAAASAANDRAVAVVNTAVRSFKAPPPRQERSTTLRAPSLAEPPATAPWVSTGSAVPSLPQSIATPAALQPPPAAASSGPVQFVPPLVSRQVRPVVVPPDLRRLLGHEVLLSFRVAVDTAGRVTSITQINRLERAEQTLSRAYADAIRTWQFEPARRDGQPFPGEAILNFRVQLSRSIP